jgi:hypothetical protein
MLALRMFPNSMLKFTGLSICLRCLTTTLELRDTFDLRRVILGIFYAGRYYQEVG